MHALARLSQAADVGTFVRQICTDRCLSKKYSLNLEKELGGGILQRALYQFYIRYYRTY